MLWEQPKNWQKDKKKKKKKKSHWFPLVTVVECVVSRVLGQDPSALLSDCEAAPMEIFLSLSLHDAALRTPALEELPGGSLPSVVTPCTQRHALSTKHSTEASTHKKTC